MSRKVVSEVPLSVSAIGKLDNIRSCYLNTPRFLTLFAGLAFALCAIPIFFASRPGELALGWGAYATYVSYILAQVVVWIITAMVYRTKGAKKISAILEENLTDYSRAECLRTQVFPRFAGAKSDGIALRETEVPGEWRAFKVEHFSSQSLRGDVTGQVCLDLRALFMGSGQVKAQIKQLAVPDLLDMSSVVFFQNDAGETLRVLVPSPRATRETLARVIEYYVGRDEGDYCRSGSLPHGTHTNEAIKAFTTDENALITPISHPALLDRLDAATQRPTAERPLVRVTGERVQEGVALATALEVEGETKKVFYPSGYLGEFATSIAFALDQNRQPANLLEAVR